MAKPGRKTKLTPELQARLVEVLAAGNYAVDACDFVGISEETYYTWLERGKRANKADREAGFPEFLESVKKAQAQAKIASVARIRKAGMEGNWLADAWFLERRDPESWGRRSVKHEISGPRGGPILTRDVTELTDDELDAIVDGD